MSKPILQIIIGSTRPRRVGGAVGGWFADVAREHGGFDVQVADLAEIRLPFLDETFHPRLRRYTHEHTIRWSERIDASDAIVIVTPEYNYSMTAPVKNALDYLYQEWLNKPVGFVSYGGMSGGMRAVQQLKQAVTTLQMFPASNTVCIQRVSGQVSDDRQVFTPDERQLASANDLLDELAKTVPVMRELRAG